MIPFQVIFNCQHRSQKGCDAGHHPSQPNPQDCKVCQHRLKVGEDRVVNVLVPPDAVEGGSSRVGYTLPQVVGGVKGIATALTGGTTPEAIVSERTAICATCPSAIMTAGILKRCKECGCSTWAKIRNANQACPLGKWQAVDKK